LQTGSTAAELKDKTERLEALRSEEEKKLDSLKAKLSEIEKEVNMRRVHANDAAETMKKMEEKHAELLGKEKDLRKELTQIEQQLSEVNEKIGEMEKKKRDLEEEAKQATAARRKKLHFQAKLSILTDEIEELQNALEKRKEGVPEAINHFEVEIHFDC
jgi:chromosome segregation ATPase